MSNPLIARLEYGADLTEADRTVLAALTKNTRQVAARQDIIHEGDQPEAVHLVLDGFACRYKMIAGGLRQNLALLVPGDLCDLHLAILDVMDHGIATLSPCTLVDIPRRAIHDLVERHPRIARALWWCTLADEGTLRAWIVNLTLREADQRLAHLFCELHVRLRAVGRAEAHGYDFPLTQEELGDTLGISSVHTNRTLMGLREAGLIELKGRYLTIPDVRRLKAYCDFDPTYLHLMRR